MLHITPIPALKDNYIWLLIHLPSSHCLIIDPGESTPVIEAITLYQWRPTALLLTHHHPDHTAGAAEIAERYHIPVYGPAGENIPAVTYPLNGQETLSFEALALNLQVLAIPGHTRNHLAYYGGNAVFCGDTLFTGGCGRLFEGTAAQMYHSLNKLTALPDNTLVCCGHEYTLNNLIFAQTIEPRNTLLLQRINEVNRRLDRGLPTVPSTLGLEKQTNPFLRCQEPSVRQSIANLTGKQHENPVDLFAALRIQKDSFKIN
jgi:hydroxyacylglutathione hydrolase